MTHAQKLAVLTQWQADIQAADGLIHPISQALFLHPESAIHTAVWGLQKALTTAVATMVDDPDNWLDWYATENDFGCKAMEASLHGDMRPIATLDDLIYLMETEA